MRKHLNSRTGKVFFDCEHPRCPSAKHRTEYTARQAWYRLQATSRRIEREETKWTASGRQNEDGTWTVTEEQR